MGEESQSDRIEMERFDVEVRRGQSGLPSLSTIVFADDYIPVSVRACIVEEASVVASPFLRSSLRVDEEARTVILTATLIELGMSWEAIMVEFLEIAAEWQARLHEGGERDLIYVKKK